VREVLPKASEAKVQAEPYWDIRGQRMACRKALFTKDETDQAEAIVKLLKGMDIDSARRLLEKVSRYLLLETVT
jgi:hypothetical protein